MKVSVLQSGSHGNSIVVECNGNYFLIEAGVSVKTLSRLLHFHGLRLAHIRGVIHSHNHADHCKYLAQYAAAGIYAMNHGLVDIHSFAVAHDAPGGTLGFHIVERETKASLCVIMDCGSFNDAMRDAINNSDAVVIGCDYDDELLGNGGYNASLQSRITSNTGHLSTQALCEFLRNDWNGRARTFILAHLSEKHNNPAMALKKVVDAMHDQHINDSIWNKVIVSTPDGPTPLITVSR